MSKEIEAILNSYHASALWEMAHEAGLTVSDARGKRLRKTAIVAIMREQFFREERVRASWQQLDEQDRAVLNQLLFHEKPVSTAMFQREVLQAELAKAAPEKIQRSYSSSDVPYAHGYIGSPHRRHSHIFEDVLSRLTLHGLAFSQDATSGWSNVAYKVQFHPAGTIYVPQVVRQFLPEPTPVAGKLENWQPTRIERGDPDLLLRDLYLYWDAVRRNEVPLIKSGLLGKRSLKAINQILLTPDPSLAQARGEDETARLYLLRRLLEELGLVHRTQGQLRAALANPLHIPEFWTLSTAEQAAACLDAWTGLQDMNELGSDAEGLAPRYGPARQALLTVLRAQPAGTWLELDEIVNKLRFLDINFLFAEQSRLATFPGNRYYYGSGYYGYPEALQKKLESLENRFVRACLSGQPYELGLVEIGHDEQNRRGFRLASAAPEKNAAAGKVILQPSFQLLALGPVSTAILARLDLFTEREQADLGAFAYHLSRDSVYRAQQWGLAVEEIIHLLEQLCDTDIPQNVHRSLQEWAAHYERIVFRRGVCLLQAADASLLEYLLQDPAAGKHLARAISPEVALVKKSRQQKLFQALIDQDLLPAISGAQPEAADKSVVVRENGEIQAVHAVPNLHLRGRLGRLAEEMDRGRWQLTPASVRQAGGSRARVLAALEELTRLGRTPLPGTLVDQIKAWGGYYGRAKTATLTLIEFGNRQALQELLQHPRLAKLLTPFQADNRALAIVPSGQLERVAEILAELGVPLKEETQL